MVYNCIDLNADVGEGMPNDAGIMPYISSANIACGFHAGDESTIQLTIDLCLQYGVAIGAHPSFADRPNFGRHEMEMAPIAAANLVLEQVKIMQRHCDEKGATLHHVKPHGALYNMSARLPDLAFHIAKAMHLYNPKLTLFGLAGSHSVAQARKVGLRVVEEFFADRTYQEDGSLTPRHQPNAMIDDETAALKQALLIATDRKLISVNGKEIWAARQRFPEDEIPNISICLHGDGPHALSFAKTINQQLSARGIKIQAFS